MLIIKSLERFRVPLFGFFDRLRFVELCRLSLSWVGQLTFSGRNPTQTDEMRDNCLSVVWLAGIRPGP
jgi:hypothetical protein